VPCFDENNRKGKYPFLGYEVRHVTWRLDDPEFADNLDRAEDENIRMQTEAEARAIAQADADLAKTCVYHPEP